MPTLDSADHSGPEARRAGVAAGEVGVADANTASATSIWKSLPIIASQIGGALCQSGRLPRRESASVVSVQTARILAVYLECGEQRAAWPSDGIRESFRRNNRSPIGFRLGIVGGGWAAACQH